MALKPENVFGGVFANNVEQYLMLEMCFFANIVVIVAGPYVGNVFFAYIVEIATGFYVENVLGVFFANIIEMVTGSYVGAPTWRLAHLLWSSVLKRQEARSPPLYPPKLSLHRLSPLLIHTPQLLGQPSYCTGRSFELALP